MKQKLSLLLALCLVFLLTACGTKPDPTTEPPTDPTTTPTAPTTLPTDAPTEPEETETVPPVEINYDLPLSAVACIPQKETTYGANDTPVFEYTYPTIQVILSDGDIAAAVNSDILSRIEVTRSEATDLMNAAVSAEPMYPYSLSVNYQPQRIDGSVLSLFGAYSVYNGGSVHHSGHGLTYDLLTGSVLTLKDVLTDTVTADILCPLVIDALSKLPKEMYLFDDFRNTAEQRFSGDFLLDESWHLSENGLCFTFAPYEVAPNSTGFVHAVIPYEQLTGILEDEWFPTERTTPDDTLSVDAFGQEKAETFDTFAEVCLDKEDDMFLLWTEGLIYDLVIESGYRSGSRFSPEYTVFRADSLVPTDAVMLQADSTDTLPLLRISYSGAEGPVTYFISISEDGIPQFDNT